jgi:hypothetical protein
LPALIALAIHDLQEIFLITQGLSSGPIGFIVKAFTDCGKV